MQRDRISERYGVHCPSCPVLRRHSSTAATGEGVFPDQPSVISLWRRDAWHKNRPKKTAVVMCCLGA